MWGILMVAVCGGGSVLTLGMTFPTKDLAEEWARNNITGFICAAYEIKT